MRTKKSERKRSALWRRNNPAKNRAYVRAAHEKMSAAVYGHYGLICAGCGEKDPDVLTLDHINNDGAKHRSNYRGKGTVQILHHEWKTTGCWRDDIQTLCANCQLRKVRHKPLPLQRVS